MSASAIAVGQITIKDLNDIFKSDIPPPNPYLDMLWLDTSTDPPKMKSWTGTKWVVVNDWSGAFEELDKVVTMNSKNGTARFSGFGQETTVVHGMGSIPSVYTADSIQNSDGSLGEVWVRADAENLYVGNTGSWTGVFHWYTMLNTGEGDNPSGTGLYSGGGKITKVPHGLKLKPSIFSAISMENSDGSLGEVWIDADDTYLYVGNTGSWTGMFHWHVVK